MNNMPRNSKHMMGYTFKDKFKSTEKYTNLNGH